MANFFWRICDSSAPEISRFFLMMSRIKFIIFNINNHATDQLNVNLLNAVSFVNEIKSQEENGFQAIL
jgi:hypothetical protein